MESLGTTIQEATFWRDSAGQLRALAHGPIDDRSLLERLLELAAEYERLPDKVVGDGGTGQPMSLRSEIKMRA
jgi:hypothetical protein